MPRPCGWLCNLCRLLYSRRSSEDIAKRVERMDKQNREVRHDLKNIEFRADALRQLVMNMREDDAWRHEGGNHNAS